MLSNGHGGGGLVFTDSSDDPSSNLYVKLLI